MVPLTRTMAVCIAVQGGPLDHGDCRRLVASKQQLADSRQQPNEPFSSQSPKNATNHREPFGKIDLTEKRHLWNKHIIRRKTKHSGSTRASASSEAPPGLAFPPPPPPPPQPKKSQTHPQGFGTCSFMDSRKIASLPSCAG